MAATFSGSGMKGDDHGPIDTAACAPRTPIPIAHGGRPWPVPRARSSSRRPEWLAENLGRPDLRVIDARWRPDGTGRQLYATGHVPGAVYVDWRADVVDVPEGADALLLAAPDRFGAIDGAGGRRRRHVGRPVRRHRVLLRGADLVDLRAYGYESARILEGGWPAWVDGGHPIAERRGRAGPGARSRPAPSSASG